jgi:hypothetical protein
VDSPALMCQTAVLSENGRTPSPLAGNRLCLRWEYRRPRHCAPSPVGWPPKVNHGGMKVSSPVTDFARVVASWFPRTAVSTLANVPLTITARYSLSPISSPLGHKVAPY